MSLELALPTIRLKDFPEPSSFESGSARHRGGAWNHIRKASSSWHLRIIEARSIITEALNRVQTRGLICRINSEK